MSKVWKIYDDKDNTFSTKTFDGNKELSSYWGYDFIYREIYNWEYSMTGCIYEMYNCLVREGDIIVDIGANIGLFSCRYADIASRVISIDGSPEAYSCLVENCKDFYNVQTLNASILSPTSDPSWLWSHKGNPLRMTLDDMMSLYKIDRIDFLKCDIEGGEYDLFNSLSKETLDKIDRIAIETHSDEKNIDFFLPGKIRHSYYWNYNGGTQTMFYFVTP
jgi:hypothetical protein